MTPAQEKLAIRLYRAYKCDTLANRQLAESLGLNTGELNSKVWHILHHERKMKEAQHAR